MEFTTALVIFIIVWKIYFNKWSFKGKEEQIWRHVAKTGLKVVPFEWYCPLVGLMIKRGRERCPLVVNDVK